jgi:hypothetical protein
MIPENSTIGSQTLAAGSIYITLSPTLQRRLPKNLSDNWGIWMMYTDFESFENCKSPMELEEIFLVLSPDKALLAIMQDMVDLQVILLLLNLA